VDVHTRLEHLETLNAIGEVLNRAPFFRQALHEALDRLVALTGASAGWVFLARIEHGDTHYSSFRLAASSTLPPALEEDDRHHLREGGCECQGLFRRGELEGGINLVTCSRLEAAHAGGSDTGGLIVHASVPLLGRSGPVGVLNLAGPGAARYEPETLTLLEAVGRQLGTAYERATAQVQRRTEAERVAALEERNRVAREIHDSVTQLLFGAHLALRVARERGDERRTADNLGRGAELVEQALDELRGLVELLRSADLEQGLAPALVRLVERVAGPVRCHLDVDEQLDALDPDTAEHVFRIVQEAVHNALKHADASHVWLRIGREQDALVLVVEDDGVGFPATLTRGVGLDSITDRTGVLGGTLGLDERPGGGARVRVEVPWPNPT
jgi:two-component system, NarL family, sensor kinase